MPRRILTGRLTANEDINDLRVTSVRKNEENTFTENQNFDKISVNEIHSADDLLISCAEEKTLVMSTSIWDDINLGAAQLSRPASSRPSLDSFRDNLGANTGIETFSFAVGEKIHGSFELIHTYKEGTDLKPHVHFQIINAPSGVDYVRWKMSYTIAQDGQTLRPVQDVFGECPVDTQYKNVFCILNDISGTGLEIGDQFLFTLERVVSEGDAFTGDALIQTVGVHHEVDTMGSRQVGKK